MQLENVLYQGIRNDRLNELRVTWTILSICNYNCEYCISNGIKTKRFVSKNNIDIIIANLKKLGYDKYKIVITGGEPTLHPYLLRIISSLHEAFPVEIKVITNGSASIDIYKTMLDAGVNLDVSVHFKNYNSSNLKKILGLPHRKNQITVLSMLHPLYFREAMELHDMILPIDSIGYVVSLIRKPPNFIETIKYSQEMLSWFNSNLINIRNSYMNPQNDIIYELTNGEIHDISSHSYHDLIYNKNNYLAFYNFYCLHDANSIYINSDNMYNGSLCSCGCNEKSFLSVHKLFPAIIQCKQSHCVCPANLVIPKSNNIEYLKYIKEEFFHV